MENQIRERKAALDRKLTTLRSCNATFLETLDKETQAIREQVESIEALRSTGCIIDQESINFAITSVMASLQRQHDQLALVFNPLVWSTVTSRVSPYATSEPPTGRDRVVVKHFVEGGTSASTPIEQLQKLREPRDTTWPTSDELQASEKTEAMVSAPSAVGESLSHDIDYKGSENNHCDRDGHNSTSEKSPDHKSNCSSWSTFISFQQQESALRDEHKQSPHAERHRCEETRLLETENSRGSDQFPRRSPQKRKRDTESDGWSIVTSFTPILYSLPKITQLKEELINYDGYLHPSNRIHIEGKDMGVTLNRHIFKGANGVVRRLRNTLLVALPYNPEYRQLPRQLLRCIWRNDGFGVVDVWRALVNYSIHGRTSDMENCAEWVRIDPTDLVRTW